MILFVLKFENKEINRLFFLVIEIIIGCFYDCFDILFFWKNELNIVYFFR